MLWDSFKDKDKVNVNVGVEFWLRHLKRIKGGCRLMQINFPTNDEIIGQRNKLLKASLKQKIGITEDDYHQRRRWKGL